METERDAFAALAHPVALGALVLWIVNDHWWKHHFANAVTGKLSDVAGLILFPLLVAAALALWVRRPIRWGVTVTIALYGSVNLFGWADRAIEAVASIVAPADLTRDPTDVLLLPVLVVPIVIWRTASARTTRRAWSHALFAVGIVTTLATSSPDISTDRYDGTFVLDRDQAGVAIPIELRQDGRVLDPSEYLQMGVDVTAFGDGGAAVARTEDLVAVDLVSTEAGWQVEYRLVEPETEAAPIEVRWSLQGQADHGDDRVSEELRLEVQSPPAEVVAEPLGEWAPEWTHPSEIRAARATVTTVGAAPQLGLTVVGLGRLEGHGFRAATADRIVDLPPRRVAAVDLPSGCSIDQRCTFDVWLSWDPGFALPPRLAVYGQDVTVEITPVRFLELDEESASTDLDVDQGSRIEVPIEVRFGRGLTPPEAITAHVDLDVEALRTGSSLTRADAGYVVCCEDGDGLYVLGEMPDERDIVAVASHRGGGGERLRVVARASLRWIPDTGPVVGDPEISIVDIDVVD